MLTIFPSRLLNDFSILHLDPGFEKSARIPGQRKTVRLAVGELDLLGKSATVRPASESAVKLSVHDPAFGKFDAVGIPFGAEAVGDALAKVFAHLDLAVGDLR